MGGMLQLGEMLLRYLRRGERQQVADSLGCIFASAAVDSYLKDRGAPQLFFTVPTQPAGVGPSAPFPPSGKPLDKAGEVPLALQCLTVACNRCLGRQESSEMPPGVFFFPQMWSHSSNIKLDVQHLL